MDDDFTWQKTQYVRDNTDEDLNWHKMMALPRNVQKPMERLYDGGGAAAERMWRNRGPTSLGAASDQDSSGNGHAETPVAKRKK